MADVVIKITADGKQAVDVARKVQDSLKGVQDQSGRTAAGLASAGQATANLSASFTDLSRASLVFSAISHAASGLVDAVTALPRAGIQFAAQTETTQLGIAGILSSMTAINGQTTSYAQGLAIARGITADLQRDAMLTAASTEELVTAFQAMVGPGLAAGMSLDQIRQLATIGVNAVKSLGLSGTQVVQELRDLVQGGITPASSTLATALGLKDEDIARAKSSSEGLFSFLMSRMKGFEEAGNAFAGSFTGRMQALQEQLVRSAAVVFEPLAQVLAEQAQGITAALADDKNVEQFQRLTSSVQMLASALGTVTQFAINHSEALVNVVAAYGALKIGARASEWVAEAAAMARTTMAVREKAVTEQAALIVKREYVAVELAAAQANAERMAGMARLSYVQQQVIPLQQQHAQAVTQVEEATKRLSVAQNLAAAASSGMGAVLGALGGPVGIAIAATTILIGKLIEMRGEANQTALVNLSKERIAAATAAGKKADDADLARVQAAIATLKNERDQLIVDQKSDGIASWLFGDDYASGLSNKLKFNATQIQGLEVVTNAATAMAQANGAQVQLQGNLAGQQVDQLLAKYNTATQLRAAAEKEKAALDTQLKNYQNSNASASDVAAKEQAVADAKKLIERKLQDDLKQLREHGLADAQAIANAQLALDRARAQTRLSSERAALDQQQHALEMSYLQGLTSESEYYARRRELRDQASAQEQATLQAEIDKTNEQLAKPNMLLKDRLSLEEKLVTLTGKQIELQSKYDKARMSAGEAANQIAFEYGRNVEQSNARLQFELTLMGKTDQERAVALAQYDVEVKRKQKILDIENKIADVAEQQKAIDSVNATAQREKQVAAQQAYLAEWKRINDQIAQSLTDAIMRGGKSGWEYVVDMVRTTVLRPIVQMVATPIASAITSLLGMSASGAAAASTGGASTTSSLGLASNISSFYKTVTGGFTALGDSVAFAANDMGAWLVNNTTGILNKAGSTLLESAGAVGTVASYTGGVLAGLGIGSAVSGKYAAFGNANISVTAGTVIGAIAGGPIGAAIGGAIGGLVNRAFGMGEKETTDYGIRGSFSTSGASVSQYENWQQDGGWFRSDESGTNISSINSALQTLLSTSLQATTSATQGYAKAIGLSADAVYGYTQSINLSLQGMDSEAQQKAIAGALSNFGESLVSAIYGSALTAFQASGETLSDTLTRLSTRLTTVNQVFDTLNVKLLAVSVTGGDVASKLVDAFGSADKFVSATSAYYEAFYSDEEKLATTTRQLHQALSDLGLQMPDSVDALRALVDAQDLSTESGRKDYAALIELTSSFKTVFAAQITAAEAAKKAQQDYVDAMLAGGKKISDWIGALSSSSLSASTSAARALQEARGNYITTLQLARGGDTTAVNDIIGQAETYLTAAKNNSGSSAEYLAVVAQIKSELGALPSTQSYQQQTVSTLQAIYQATELVKSATEGVVDNTDPLGATASAQVQALLAINNDGMFSVSKNTASALDYLAAIKAIASNIDVSTAKTAANPTTVVSGGGGGGIISSVISAFGFAKGDVFDGPGVYTQPTYFNYAGQLAAIGEAGPEVVMPVTRLADGAMGVRATQQLMIQQVASVGDTAAIQALLIQLIEEGRAQSRASVDAQRRLVRLLERWDGGLPETRVVA